jgi:hypothetical protein
MFLLVLLGYLWFTAELFLGETQYFRDLTFYSLPFRKLLVDFAVSGHIPLWNPLHHGGQAFITSVSTSTLTPLNALFFILEPIRALNLMLATCVASCCGGAYVLARQLGFSKMPSVVCSLVFSFSGVALSQVNLLNQLLALAHLPWLMTFWHLWLRESRGRDVVLTVITAVSQFVSGSPEMSALSFALMLVWPWLFGPAASTRTKRLFRFSVVLSLTLGLIAVQLLPTLEVIHASPRGYGMGGQEIGHWSLHLARLPELVLPSFFGHVDRISPEAYWGEKHVDKGPLFNSIYVGVPTVFLVLFAGLTRREQMVLSRRTRLVLIICCGIAPVLALGRFLPGFESLAPHVPLISVFRYPSKMLYMGMLPVALLAASAAEELGSAGRKLPNRIERLSLIGLASAGVLCLVMAFAVGSGIADRVLQSYFETPATEIMHQGLSESMRHAAGTAFLTALWLVLRRRSTRSFTPWCLALVILVDLGVSGRRVNPSCPEWVIREELPAVTVIREVVGDGRLYRTPVRHINLKTPNDDLAWAYRWQLESLTFATAAAHGIPEIYHDDVAHIAPIPIMKLSYYVKSQPWNVRLPLLASAAVRIVASDELLEVPGLSHLSTIPATGGPSVHLYRIENTAPRVGFVTEARQVESDEDALAIMWSGDFDPKAEVLLMDGRAEDVQPIARRVVHSSRVEPIRSGPNRRTVQVSTDSDGYLVLAETYAPGWVATVNGRPTPILRANVAFCALPLDRGDHLVEMRYMPVSLRVGAVISVATLIIGIALLLMGRRRGQ